MNEYLVGIGLALWFGILTSISPCPLATNVAAVSFITRKTGNFRGTAWSGIMYCAGRMFAYTVIGLLVTRSLFAVPTVSFFLQKYLNLFLGPLLIIIGMFLLEILEFHLNGAKFTEKLQQRLKDGSMVSNFLLGAVFALTFCPALFFGSLIPLAVKLNDTILPAVVFGFGTALPVILVTAFLASGIRSVGVMFNKITQIEQWVRGGTGGLIIIIGVYLTFTNIFGM